MHRRESCAVVRRKVKFYPLWSHLLLFYDSQGMLLPGVSRQQCSPHNTMCWVCSPHPGARKTEAWQMVNETLNGASKWHHAVG